jgi:RimJ/RimL family protein N-acetyltransferase
MIEDETQFESEVAEPTAAAVVPPEQPLADDVIMLREWSIADLDAVHAAVQDAEIPRFTGIPEHHTLEGVERWLSARAGEMAAGRDASFAIVDAVDGHLLGSVGIERSIEDPAVGEVGYWVAAASRDQGVATRAVRLIVPWAFEVMGLARIQLTTHPNNPASQRVAGRCGFQYEGVLRGYREQHGERVDLAMYARLATD